MMALLLFISFLVLIFLGFPIAFSLGLSSLLYLITADISLSIIPQKMFEGLNSFVLLCIPGFILAGNLMNAGGITSRLIDFANSLLGRVRGDRKSTRLNSSHVAISYAVFCLKKKTTKDMFDVDLIVQ